MSNPKSDLRTVLAHNITVTFNALQEENVHKKQHKKKQELCLKSRQSHFVSITFVKYVLHK